MVLVAVGQICSTASISHNLDQCLALVEKTSSAGAKTLFLPEAADYIASNASESLTLAQPASSSPFVQGLQKAAKEHNLEINVGIHEPSEEQGKVKNTSIWIDTKGEIIQRYQKLHLFDIDILNGPQMKESNGVEKGKEVLKPFNTNIGTVGMAICFDLRYPQLSTSLRRQGAQIILYPSAFAPHTGKAHWEPLLRARAIETQSYVIAAAQVGRHNDKRASYGHSMVVDPWGEVVASLMGEGDVGKICMWEVDLEKVERTRREMPLKVREDVYGEV